MPGILGEIWCSWGGARNCHEGFWGQGLGLQSSVLLTTQRETEEAANNTQDTVTPKLNKLAAEQQSDMRMFVEEQLLFPGSTGTVNLCSGNP